MYTVAAGDVVLIGVGAVDELVDSVLGDAVVGGSGTEEFESC